MHTLLLHNAFEYEIENKLISLYRSVTSRHRIVKKVPPAPMAHRAAPISVSSSPRPHVCGWSESYSGGGVVHW